MNVRIYLNIFKAAVNIYLSNYDIKIEAKQTFFPFVTSQRSNHTFKMPALKTAAATYSLWQVRHFKGTGLGKAKEDLKNSFLVLVEWGSSGQQRMDCVLQGEPLGEDRVWEEMSASHLVQKRQRSLQGIHRRENLDGVQAEMAGAAGLRRAFRGLWKELACRDSNFNHVDNFNRPAWRTFHQYLFVHHLSSCLLKFSILHGLNWVWGHFYLITRDGRRLRI